MEATVNGLGHDVIPAAPVVLLNATLVVIPACAVMDAKTVMLPKRTNILIFIFIGFMMIAIFLLECAVKLTATGLFWNGRNYESPRGFSGK